MKSRGVYETPGGTILHAAHRALESITMDREVMHLRDSLIPRYAEMIYYGYWFAPEREMLQKAIDAPQANVTGRVRLKLYKGNVIVAGRKSDSSLYDPDVATFEADQVYRQSDADGFIRLNALRLRLAALSRTEEGLKGSKIWEFNLKSKCGPAGPKAESNKEAGEKALGRTVCRGDIACRRSFYRVGRYRCAALPP